MPPTKKSKEVKSSNTTSEHSSPLRKSSAWYLYFVPFLFGSILIKHVMPSLSKASSQNESRTFINCNISTVPWKYHKLFYSMIGPLGTCIFGRLLLTVILSALMEGPGVSCAIHEEDKWQTTGWHKGCEVGVGYLTVKEREREKERVWSWLSVGAHPLVRYMSDIWYQSLVIYEAGCLPEVVKIYSALINVSDLG